MLKKIVFSIFILGILGLSAFSVIMMYRGDNSYTVNIDPSKLEDFTVNTDDQWIVRKGNIQRVLHFTGNVAPADERALVNVKITDKDAEICVSVGDTVNKGDTVYKSTAGNNQAESKMKCMKITSSPDTVITFLNFENLYMEAQIPYECANDDVFHSEVMLSAGGSEFKGKFRYVDYINNHGNVYSEIAFDNSSVCLYPGSEISADFVVEKKTDVLLIPLAFVVSKGNGEYKAQVLGNGKIHYQTIKLGVIGDSMAEVTQGLEENTVLICPDEADSLLSNMNLNPVGK